MPIERDRITIVDGDTVRIGVRMRVFGCDTPEIRNVRCDAEREWGQRAAKRLGGLLDAGPVTFNVSEKRDPYGRPVVWLAVNGTSVCETLIAERLAAPDSEKGPRMDWCARHRGRR